MIMTLEKYINMGLLGATFAIYERGASLHSSDKTLKIKTTTNTFFKQVNPTTSVWKQGRSRCVQRFNQMSPLQNKNKAKKSKGICQKTQPSCF